jgi:hypothetical protein
MIGIRVTVVVEEEATLVVVETVTEAEAAVMIGTANTSPGAV